MIPKASLITNDGMILFATLLTTAAYLVGVCVQRRTKVALLNPVLLGILLVGVSLRALHIPYSRYFSGAQPLNFLLGPAIVALPSH